MILHSPMSGSVCMCTLNFGEFDLMRPAKQITGGGLCDHTDCGGNIAYRMY